MTKPRVTVIDYGVGNVLSVCRAFEECDADVELTGDPARISRADHLVLPGVGAFADGMDGLRARGLVGPIRTYAGEDRPFLGICLGMQMMLDESHEFGRWEGLGLIAGVVEEIPGTTAAGQRHKIPHIGWSEIEECRGPGAWQATILEGIEPDSCFYFVHSFTAVPTHQENRVADCSYNGRQISAVINRGRLFGCQFHPEKSGPTGLRILHNFCEMEP